MIICTRALTIVLMLLLAACSSLTQQTLPEPQPSSNNQAVRDSLVELSKKIKALCDQAEYSVYFTKTFCTPIDSTPAMMTDMRKINRAEKAALQAWAPVYDKLATEMNSLLGSTSTVNKRMADYNETVTVPAAQKNRQALYEGRITWGEYNRKRRQISDDIAEESRRLAQPDKD